MDSKRSYLAWVIVWATVIGGCFSSTPLPPSTPTPAARTVAQQVIVGFASGLAPAALSAGDVELAKVQSCPLGSTVGLYQLPSTASPSAVLDALHHRIGISWAQQNQVENTSSTWPDDPDLWLQWDLTSRCLNPDPLWNRGIDTSHVTVAVLDTGIDPYHPDFGGRVMLGLNTITGDNDSIDTDGHGTHVAGILAATGNNDLGIAGICWQCKLLAVKVLGDSGGDDAEALAGIKYAVDHGAEVINMSFNSQDTAVSPAYESFINYALAKNVVVVAAAGNDGGAVTQPATTPGLLAVAATGEDGTLASYSNRGSIVGVAAPGTDIFSTFLNDGYKTDTGTSMAAPVVSGAAAILRAEHPTWSAQQIISAIEGATDPVISLTDQTMHFGRLDLSKLP